MVIFSLRYGDYEADLVPQIGGGLAAFRWQGQDVMRAATRSAVAALDPLGLAMFPMVPWSNRVAHGRFSFGDRQLALPRNMGDHPHAIHGHGWQRPWTVVESSLSSARLVYDHVPDAWPWAYRAELAHVLTDTGLETRLSVENQAAESMPAGLGLHPYFVRTPQMQVHAELDGWWETDVDVMPTVHHATATRTDWSNRLHGDRTTDTVFTGWDGTAQLIWPETGVALKMTASQAARWLVIYAPVGESIACVEPVTHPTDAFNQPGRPGIRILQPGERADLSAQFQASRF